MNILMSNDDGYFSPTLKALMDAAVKRGHFVLCCAPDSPCSAKSQCLTLTHPLILHKKEMTENAHLYSLEGTPADCVRVAPFIEDIKFDVCISGINKGENVSTGIFYSGTVAAAREGAMMNLPSVAVSMAVPLDEEAVAWVADMAVKAAEKIVSHPLPRFGVLNINAPAGPRSGWKEAVVCPISDSYFLDGYEVRKSPFGKDYLWLKDEAGDGNVVMEPHKEGTDAYMLERGYITFTILGPLADQNGYIDGKFMGEISEITL